MSGRTPILDAPRRRFAVSSTNAGLGALLVGLVVVFTLVIGENFFSTAALRSMALQMPELGILSLAMMITLLAGGDRASAATIIKDPNPPEYKVEIEPKLNIAYLFWQSYGGGAWGPGVHFSIPIMSPGFVKTINNSVAIGFGLDIMRFDGNYNGYYYGYCQGNPKNCPGFYNGYYSGFWAIELPVVMQWNFFITEHWSVFGEPGLTLRHAFYPSCPSYYDPRFGPCYPDRTTPYFTFYAGGRYHFSEKIALTMRLGHPIDFSIGVSFFL